MGRAQSDVCSCFGIGLSNTARQSSGRPAVPSGTRPRSLQNRPSSRKFTADLGVPVMLLKSRSNLLTSPETFLPTKHLCRNVTTCVELCHRLAGREIVKIAPVSCFEQCSQICREVGELIQVEEGVLDRVCCYPRAQDEHCCQGEVIDIRTCAKKRPENKRHVRALQLRRTEERV